MSEPLRAGQGALWLQKTPGQTVEYLGCTDLDDLSEPAGDITPIQCRNADGIVETVSESQAPAGAVTTSFTTLVYPENNILDTIRRCPTNLYALQRLCGRADIFDNYVRGYVFEHGNITSKTYANIVKRTEDGESTQAYALSGRKLWKIRQLTVVRQTIGETRDINDVVFCNTEQCAGSCGEQKDPGTDGFAVSDGSAPSPIADADVWITTDKGSTWANATALLATPFHLGVNIMAAVCFAMSGTTTRLLVAKGTETGEHLEISYSDDDGATWTIVEVATNDGEGCAGAHALFALDRAHIWLGSTAGRIYFSDDGGITWTEQASAVTESGGNQINAIVFSDYENGYAVGNTDTIIKSVDGGDNWTAVTSPTTADNVTAVWTFSKSRVLIGSNADEMWQSWDGGDSWVAETFTGSVGTGTIRGFDFVSELIGFMVHNTAGPRGTVHRTVNGGANWEPLVTPDNAGLNSIEAIDENTAFASGNVYAGTGVVLRVSG